MNAESVTAFSPQPFTTWFSWLYLFALAMGLLTFFYLIRPLLKIIRSDGIRDSLHDGGTIAVGLLAALFVYITFLLAQEGVTTTYEKYDRYRTYERGECAVVEGYVTSYHRLSADAHESFTVEDVTFSFGAHEADEYHYALCQKDGGILKEGMHVRIYYVPDRHSGGYIMRIDTLP